MSTPHTAQLGRRSLLVAGGLATLAIGAGCSNSNKKSTSPKVATELKLPTYVAPPLVEGGVRSKVEGVPALYTKPIPTYTPSVDKKPLSGGEVTTFQVLWGTPPRSAPANKYWTQLNERLGGTFKPTLVAFDTYNQKLATTIASGSVPDLVFIQDGDAVGAKAISDGVFADLSEALAGDNIKKWPNLANVGTGAWKASAKNGHIYGVPNEDPYLTNFPAIRWDLMEAAGHKDMPADADGFLTMMSDIAKMKKHNGKQHWGIVAFDGKIQAVIEWMFGVGTTWQLKDGKLVHAIETDAYAQALEFQRKLWQAGVYHPDALAMATQGNKAADMFTAGQSAITVDSYNGFFGADIFINTAKNTPEADARLFVPPAAKGKELVIQRNDGYWGMVGISSKAAKDPKRLEELLNVLNYWRAPEGSTEALFIHNGIEGWNFTFGKDKEIVGKGDEKADADRAALQWLGAFKSPSFVITGERLKYKDNFIQTVEALTAKTVPSPVVGIYNEANAESGARMAAVDTDYRGGMVSGRMKMDIEAYRKAWRQAGGDKVRAAYEAALAKAK